jgi:phytoene synthase
MRLLATIDWRSAACTGAMAGIYRRLLENIAASPQAVLQGRMSLPGKEKALVAVRALSGLDRRSALLSLRPRPAGETTPRYRQADQRPEKGTR